MDKRAALLDLAKLRQASRWEPHGCVGDYLGGVYECSFVSPYTKSAGNVDAEIMVVLQDWSADKSETLHSRNDEVVKRGYNPDRPTTKNLIELLDSVFKVRLDEIYATNLFPFIKRGSISARIPKVDLLRAAKEFALPQIQIVSPRLVVCLGQATFDALRRARGLPTIGSVSAAIESPFDLGETRVWCQAHTGRLGRANRNNGRIDRVSQDWKRMKDDFAARGGGTGHPKA